MPKVSYPDCLKEDSSIEGLLSEEVTEGVLSKEKISKRNSFPNARIQGKKLKSNEITKLMTEHKYFCSCLKEPHRFDGVFTGYCTILEFYACKYPRVLANPSRNDCPIYIENEKELERKARESYWIEDRFLNSILFKVKRECWYNIFQLQLNFLLL